MSGGAAAARNHTLKMEALIDERRARVASYKVLGRSIRQTITELTKDGHVNPTTQKPWSVGIITSDIEFLRAHWRAEALKHIDEHIALELQTLDKAEHEAWNAWIRSIGKRQITYTEKKGGGRAGGGDRASVRTVEEVGEPRFLQIVLQCRKDRRAILGLDSPTRIQASGPGGGPIETKGTADLKDLPTEQLRAFLSVAAALKTKA